MDRKKAKPTAKHVEKPTVGKGALIIIGGKEDKESEMKILKEVARRVGKGTLCIATVASTVGDELWVIYRDLFKSLGIKKITHLDVVCRVNKVDVKALKAVEQADAVFFTGGDQLKITSELGGTAIAERIHQIHLDGGVIAGTSAGASVMGETMMVAGSSDTSYRIGGALKMAPGLGLVRNILIDQHFAERGRVGRLLGATAHNPKYVGIGIDENTSIVVENDTFTVIGDGAVYVLDAHEATHCNISEAEKDTTLSICNVAFHLLSEGDQYNLITRTPIPRKEES